MKYTYSDEEDEIYSDATTSRRSTRTTRTHTPAEGLIPTVTLSGRQVKARQGGTYGESMLSGAQNSAVAVGGSDGISDDPDENDEGRPRRAAATNGWGSRGGAHIEGYNSVDEMDSDEDDASEQDYGDDEEEDEHVPLDSDADGVDITDDEELDEDLDDKKTLLIKLPVKTPTPEKENASIKLRLTPEQSSTASVQEGVSNSVPPAQTLVPAAQLASGKEEPGADSEAVSPESPSASAAPAPLSPLAFRGSPEKPLVFAPSIDVGYGGS
jgi:hypothetical protein